MGRPGVVTVEVVAPVVVTETLEAKGVQTRVVVPSTPRDGVVYPPNAPGALRPISLNPRTTSGPSYVPVRSVDDGHGREWDGHRENRVHTVCPHLVRPDLQVATSSPGRSLPPGATRGGMLASEATLLPRDPGPVTECSPDTREGETQGPRDTKRLEPCY